MGRKLKRIVAIIALVFIGLFSVSFVAFLVDNTLLNGAIGYFALFTGGIGLALFFVIKLSRSPEDAMSDEKAPAPKADEDDKKAAPDEKSEDGVADEKSEAEDKKE